MMSLRLVSSLLCSSFTLVACGDASPEEVDAAADASADAAADTTADTTADATADASPDVSSACGPEDRQACLYRTEGDYEVQILEVPGLGYTDLLGAARNVNVAIYRPLSAPTPLPVVLLSHGGASGKVDPMKSMEHWAPVIARAGYLAVAIAHEGRDDASYAALCQALAVDPDHVCSVKVSWDRPNDVARVLAYLDERSREGGLAGILDLTRVAHVGHSAGAGAALMSVGATRNYTCALPFGYSDPDQDCRVEDLVSQALDEIDVAIAMSPQGPGSEGFMAESYGAVTRPVLIGTGANDGDAGEPDNRLAIFPLLPAGDKHRLYVDDQGAKHTLFEGSLEACSPIAGQAKCERMRQAIFATALAFLDAYLRDSDAARAWLASDDLETAGDGILDLQRR